jgi:hypothetical protein
MVTVSLPAFRIREDLVSFDDVLKRRGTLRAYPIGTQLLDEFTKGVLDTTCRFGARDAQNKMVIPQCHGPSSSASDRRINPPVAGVRSLIEVFAAKSWLVP